MRYTLQSIICSLLAMFILVGCDSQPRRTTIIQEDQSDTSRFKPMYNIFIENSASMNGYVKGVTEFEQVVYNYLTDIKISKLTDSLNLNYINSKIIPRGSDIEDFILKLEPNSFSKYGGNIGVTDLSEVIKMVLQNTSDSTVSVLISDLIFSPGKGKDAEEYLVNQQIGVKSKVAEHIANYPNHSILIYQLDSKFSGIFYDRNDSKSSYTGKRPFYILMIGHNDHLIDLVNNCPTSKFKGDGVKNVFSISNSNIPIDYSIQYGSGNFKLDRQNPANSIVNANKGTKGSGGKLLKFSVNANFSKLLCGSDYLMDNNNYILSDKDYSVQITPIKQLGKFTHTLKFSTSIVKPTTLSIKLKSVLPKWIDEYNDSSGIGINDDNLDKTYGIKYLLSGIYEAYTNKDEIYTTLIINVNK